MSENERGEGLPVDADRDDTAALLMHHWGVDDSDEAAYDTACQEFDAITAGEFRIIHRAVRHPCAPFPEGAVSAVKIQRFLRPPDLYEATTWLCGVEPDHRPKRRSTKRILAAKGIFWGALLEIGLSKLEIADMVGTDHSTIRYVLTHHPPAPCYISAVIERATEQVAQET